MMTVSNIILVSLLTFIALIVALSLTGKKTFHVETFISAKPDAVWSALVAESDYPLWNSVLIPLDGQKIELGKDVKYTMTNHNGITSEVSIHVAKMIKNKELNQVGGFPFLLTFEHSYILQEHNGGTLLIQHEVDEGLWMWFWDSSWIEPAYEKTANNLKRIVENKH